MIRRRDDTLRLRLRISSNPFSDSFTAKSMTCRIRSNWFGNRYSHSKVFLFSVDLSVGMTIVTTHMRSLVA